MTKSAPTTRDHAGPLAGVRVVDLGGIGPGPFAAMVLSDLGAEVIRVQRPVDLATAPNAVLDRGKRSVVVDLKDPAGVSVVRRLAQTADIVIEGFRPGVAERLGVGPGELQTARPALVYGRITGYGQSGPDSQRPGHDLNYIATSGVLDSLGRAGEPPAFPVNLVGDFGGGGMLLVVGVLAALSEARATGKGRVVDAAMVEGASLLWAMMYGFEAAGTWSADRGTNVLDSGAPFYDVYRTLDDRYVAVAALEPQFYAALVETLGLGDQLSEGAVTRHEEKRHWPEIRQALTSAFASRTRAELTSLFDGVDACFTPVLSRAEAAAAAHNRTRSTHLLDEQGAVHPAPAPRFGAYDQASASVRYPAPALPAAAQHAGADTLAVLGEAGLSAAELRSLEARGLIAQHRQDVEQRERSA